MLASELTQKIITRARELGLERVGFAPAESPVRAEIFRGWLADGKAGTMTYLNRTAEKRINPELVLPGAKTIICAAESYFTKRLPPEIRDDPSRGLIAAYAWGKDYHDVLRIKLEELAAFIHELEPDAKTKCCVDAEPIMERDHAERAGLGFIGKNTLVIHPKHGSMFFLGEIVTTLELPFAPPPPLPSCGSCTRCLDVCPTHALPAAYVLDSTRCISYLTIEFKGEIPVELRPKMGNHVFGCDDCQDCCPWNVRFSNPTRERQYHAALERQAPKLEELAMLTTESFAEKFAGSPVLRPKYEGFLRNVAVALGNWGTKEALEILEHLCSSASPLVRSHAEWGRAEHKKPRHGRDVGAIDSGGGAAAE